ncbi:hypothetical protein MRX96_030770 [Rhipicephalus microplus]
MFVWGPTLTREGIGSAGRECGRSHCAQAGAGRQAPDSRRRKRRETDASEEISSLASSAVAGTSRQHVGEASDALA